VRPCERLRPEIPGYLSGEMSGPERERLEEHLAECTDCTGILAECGEVAALITVAALEATPPPGFENEVFEWLALDNIAGLVSTAPLEKDAPVDLERRAMHRAGVFDRSVGRWPRVAVALAPGFAAAAVVLAVLAVNLRSDQFDPPGERVQSLQFAGLTTPAMRGEGDLYDSGEGDYLVVVEGDDLTAPFGHHYEVWMTGASGRVFAGSFKEADLTPAILSVGVNPYEYPVVSIWLERDDNDTGMEISGEVVMRASIHNGSPAPLQSATP
jgi:hypothetical protein